MECICKFRNEIDLIDTIWIWSSEKKNIHKEIGQTKKCLHIKWADDLAFHLQSNYDLKQHIQNRTTRKWKFFSVGDFKIKKKSGVMIQ